MIRKTKQRINLRARQKRENLAMNRKTSCQHGFDVACLICGFGCDENGKRVWHCCSKEFNHESQ